MAGARRKVHESRSHDAGHGRLKGGCAQAIARRCVRALWRTAAEIRTTLGLIGLAVAGVVIGTLVGSPLLRRMPKVVPPYGCFAVVGLALLCYLRAV